MKKDNHQAINRRDFLKIVGISTATTAPLLSGCSSDSGMASGSGSSTPIPTDRMTYRTTPSTKDKVSILGYGCMRLPTIAKSSARDSDDEIDQEMVNRLTDYAIEHGVNYFDTAYPYHNGQSEPFVGRVIAKWERSSFYLATKMPLWTCKSLADAQRIFEEQLQRLGVEYIDFYLLHSLHKSRYEQAKELGIVDWLWQQKAAGRIRNFGFSCHDNAAGFEAILRDQPWDFCQLQYNYLDRDDRAEEISGDRGYQLTEECGVPLIIMEPIKGGTLAALPADAAAPLRALHPDASDASWALRWVAGHPNVHVVLSGMSAEEQLADNLTTFDHFVPLSPAEDAAVEQAAAVLHSRIKIGCTGCRYCIKRICTAVMRDEQTVLPVSSLMVGEYGLSDLAISMPTVVGRDGVVCRVPVSLNDDEQHELTASAKALKDIIDSVDFSC